MPDNVTILYRGAQYELGRGPGFYGIWAVGARNPQAQPQPFEWWHETPEGWYGAWARFTGIEQPGTIVPVQAAPQPGPAPAGPAEPGTAQSDPAQPGGAAQPSDITQPDITQPDITQPGFAQPGPTAQYPAGQYGGYPAGASPYGTPPYSPVAYATPRAAQNSPSPLAITASALLAVGVVLGIAGLFPGYLYGQSLASVASNLVPHLIYLAAWTASAILILLGGGRQRNGALLAAGVSAVTFGLFVSDAGSVIAHGTHVMGAGLVLGCLGWVVCAAGSGLALALPPVTWPAWPRRWTPGQIWTLAGAALGGIGAAIAFAPSWDSFTVRQPNGTIHHLTAGNAFDNPGGVITGDVIVMVVFVVVVLAAALWRPAREGGALLAAAIIPLVAQAISAFVQLTRPASEQFGLTPAQAAREGLTFTGGLTTAFWIYCLFLVILIALCSWLLVPRRPLTQSTAPSPVGTLG